MGTTFRPYKIFQLVVGTGRFELPTPRTPSECSTRLSHVPTLIRTRSSNGVDWEILHHLPVLSFRALGLSLFQQSKLNLLLYRINPVHQDPHPLSQPENSSAALADNFARVLVIG